MKRLVLMMATPLALCLAGEVEVRNGVEGDVISTSKLLLRLRGEVRSADAFQRFKSFRAVADVRWMAARHFTVVSVFQAEEARSSTRTWDESNRWLNGLEFPFTVRKVNLAVRAGEEHYFLPKGASYDRIRGRFAARWTRLRIQPMTGTEWFTDKDGWAGTRATCGALIPLGRRLALDTGYHYEFRPRRLGGDRHIVLTYLRIRRPR